MKEIIVFALDDNEIKELTGSKDEEELSIWRSYIPSPPRITGELIRCKDCRYCDDSGKSNALKCTNWYIDVDPHPDFYCGYGMRKEE